jgi:hypothetical protein
VPPPACPSATLPSRVRPAAAVPKPGWGDHVCGADLRARAGVRDEDAPAA